MVMSCHVKNQQRHLFQVSFMKGKGGRMGLGDPEDPEGLASFVFGHVRYLWTSLNKSLFFGMIDIPKHTPIFLGGKWSLVPIVFWFLNISWKLPEMEEYGTIPTMVSSCFIHSLWFCSYSFQKMWRLICWVALIQHQHRHIVLTFSWKAHTVIYMYLHIFTLQLSRASKLWVTLRCLIYRTCILGCLPANLACTHLRIKRSGSFPAFAAKRRQSAVTFGGHVFTRKFVHLSCMAHRSTCLMRWSSFQYFSVSPST